MIHIHSDSDIGQLTPTQPKARGRLLSLLQSYSSSRADLPVLGLALPVIDIHDSNSLSRTLSALIRC
jgi:hypothetical protein